MENIQKTELRKLADCRSMGEYPEAMEQVFAEMNNKDIPACNIQLVDSLQERYGVFGKY